jgi:XTP/dITP diphosphohydrolase
MKKILFATTNEGKVKEINTILSEFPIQVLSLKDIATPSITELNIEETGSTFTENAIIKARGYAEATGLITLCDDSGLVVDALRGDPGVHSKRYGSTDESRNQKLLSELSGVDETKRSARFVCAIAIYDPHTNTTHTVEGRSEGHITSEAMGNNGFGYDPVFYSTELGKTFAQASTSEKNQVSHRGRAMTKAKQILKQML